MLLPSSGSLEGTVNAAVGEEGLATVRRCCGWHFSLSDLRREIAAMPEGRPERRILVIVAEIVARAHRQLIGRAQEAPPATGE
ncbi:MAG: hypothetical protein PHI23_02565 [Candidatus Peribacteraceae bacterium]|nr:hypothetical protein [Candidatus Peribacteraceae bacterium]